MPETVEEEIVIPRDVGLLDVLADRFEQFLESKPVVFNELQFFLAVIPTLKILMQSIIHESRFVIALQQLVLAADQIDERKQHQRHGYDPLLPVNDQSTAVPIDLDRHDTAEEMFVLVLHHIDQIIEQLPALFNFPIVISLIHRNDHMRGLFYDSQ